MIFRMTPQGSNDVGPDPAEDLGAVEPVETARGYNVEVAVPLTSAQIVAVERYAQEQRIDVAEALQRLVDAALAARSRR